MLQKGAVKALIGNGLSQLCFEELTNADGTYTVLLENVAETDLQACAGVGYFNCRLRRFPDLPQSPRTADEDGCRERRWSGNLYRREKLRDHFDDRKEHAKTREDICDRLPLVLRNSEPEIVQRLHGHCPALFIIHGV
jgi:hypothetical protein